MRKIYLASDSKPRKRLFRIFGLAFSIMASNAKERRRPAGLSYKELVKSNAMSKAQTVSAKVNGGIIIGADTIVVQGKEIFGKPETMQGAKRMLKKLSGNTQMIYTGLAMIDKDKNIKKTACEITKIYMDKLTNAEIEKYLLCMSPLSKAGGFDIEGKGALFVRRVEGCFYNVIGLPLRRLYLMLKDAGVL